MVKNSMLRDTSFFRSEKYRNKMSVILTKKRRSDSYGEEFKRKCRENKLKQISKCGVQRTFNVNACKFMDKLNRGLGIKLQHGMNGGEIQFIGYSLDGYDEKNNIVFEYDEPKHHIMSVKNKDLERQNRLISYLSPKVFLRYDEKNNVLCDVVSGKEIS